MLTFEIGDLASLKDSIYVFHRSCFLRWTLQVLIFRVKNIFIGISREYLDIIYDSLLHLINCEYKGLSQRPGAVDVIKSNNPPLISSL